MDEKSVHPFPDNDGAAEISRTLRDVPPSDYLFEIKSFSLLSKAEEKRFESNDFESCGYKWKLCLYPNGDEKRNGKDHISLEMGECLSLKEETYDNSYTWEIEKFSEKKDECLFSDPFTIGEHKWKILVYPKGSGNGKGKSLSVFLCLDNCESLPTKLKLYVEFSVLVKHQVTGKHCEKKGKYWLSDLNKSFDYDLISLHDLYDESKGFVVRDSLVVEGQIRVMGDVKEFSLEMPAVEARDV